MIISWNTRNINFTIFVETTLFSNVLPVFFSKVPQVFLKKETTMRIPPYNPTLLNYRTLNCHLSTTADRSAFLPTPKFSDPVKICHDNEQFCRRLRLHEYFLSNGDANKQPVHNHRCQTRWTPPNGRNTLIDSFFQLH